MLDLNVIFSPLGLNCWGFVSQDGNPNGTNLNTWGFLYPFNGNWSEVLPLVVTNWMLYDPTIATSWTEVNPSITTTWTELQPFVP